MEIKPIIGYINEGIPGEIIEGIPRRIPDGMLGNISEGILGAVDKSIPGIPNEFPEKNIQEEVLSESQGNFTNGT